MNEGRGRKERSYDVHGAVVVKVVGQDPVADAIDRTLALFKSSPKAPDLTLVFGEFPSQEWKPIGTLVGDRFLYDSNSGTTTILGGRAITSPGRSDVEYVVIGDLRVSGEPVSVFIPKPRRPIGRRKSLGEELKHGRLRRTMLAVAGNPFGLQLVARQAERITEAIIEPFLFYRLPARGLSLVQAACLSSQGSATLFTGSANIGKSTLALHFVKEKMAFLGDELVILGKSGEVLPYPGLVKLQGHHLARFPELTARLTSGMNQIGARILRGELAASPDETLGLMPQPQMIELFEDIMIPWRSEVKNVVLVRRGSYAEATCKEIDARSLANALGEELYWGIEAASWRNGQFVYCPSAVAGRDFLQEAAEQHAKVSEILLGGISRARCYEIALPLDAPVQLVENLLPGILGSK